MRTKGFGLIHDRTIDRERIYAVIVDAAGKTHRWVRGPQLDAVPATQDFSTDGLLTEKRNITFKGEIIGTVALFATARHITEELKGMFLSIVASVLALDAS